MTRALMFMACGILFNHKCLSATTPLIVRQDGIVNVVTADELVPLRQKRPSVQTFDLAGVEIWDGTDWTQLKAITATRRRATDPNPRYLRPTEVDHLRGDASKAREKLGWQPKVSFKELITRMVTADEEDVRSALAGRAPQM